MYAIRSYYGRVDTILRRVDETYCDPLELRPDSQLGIAGLVQAIRRGGVKMANPLGSGILENLGLNPFMPYLARYFFRITSSNVCYTKLLRREPLTPGTGNL